MPHYNGIKEKKIVLKNEIIDKKEQWRHPGKDFEFNKTTIKLKH